MGVRPTGNDLVSRIADSLLYILLWLWNHPRAKYIRKVLYNFKLTVICGVITVLVFRGTVGAGKFGTLQDDVQLVNLELKTFQENRLLQSAESQKLLWEESMESNGPYFIGPPIRDWDAQRSKFIALDPGSNETHGGKPLVMIVSGSQPTPCEYNVGDHLHVKFLKTKVDYARMKGMKIYYHMVRLDKEMTGLWAKLPLLRRLLVAHPEIEWFWWMDPDAAITDMKFDMPWKKYDGFNMVVPGWDELVYKEKDWVGLSTGSFLLRNCQWSLDLLEAWSKMGVKGKPRNEAGKLLTGALKGRPDIPADDQSALVYLMVQDKPVWGNKVFLESKYYLHGYWVNLVDKFEKMMEKSHPGYGDDRWPFVVHFVGCQLCGIAGEYDVQKCITQMARAFNFADNQVVKPYGFSHLRLNSSVLLPTKETTRITIVETHFARKKLQKSRKEKVGVKTFKDNLVWEDNSANATDSALPPSTQSLVDELLAEGVLALAPGSSAGGVGVSSLQIVPTKERPIMHAQLTEQGAGGQSVNWGPKGGQSMADWRDNVEGIEEEELQEKRLEEAESQQLLKQEGQFLQEREKEEARARGEEVGADGKVGGAAASLDPSQTGGAMDRLEEELAKKEGKAAPTNVAAAEEEVEGLNLGDRAAQEEELDRAMRQKEQPGAGDAAAAEAAAGAEEGETDVPKVEDAEVEGVEGEEKPALKTPAGSATSSLKGGAALAKDDGSLGAEEEDEDEDAAAKSTALPKSQKAAASEGAVTAAADEEEASGEEAAAGAGASVAAAADSTSTDEDLMEESEFGSASGLTKATITRTVAGTTGSVKKAADTPLKTSSRLSMPGGASIAKPTAEADEELADGADADDAASTATAAAANNEAMAEEADIEDASKEDEGEEEALPAKSKPTTQALGLPKGKPMSEDSEEEEEEAVDSPAVQPLVAKKPATQSLGLAKAKPESEDSEEEEGLDSLERRADDVELPTKAAVKSSQTVEDVDE